MTSDQAVDHVMTSLGQELREWDFFQLAALLPHDKEIYIYGGGDMGHKAYAEMQRLHIPAAGYTDRSGNAQLLPVPFYTLEQMAKKEAGHIAVLICYVANFYDDTIETLKNAGIHDIIIPVNFFAQNQVFSDDLRKNDRYIKNRQNEIMETLNLLEDDESRDVFCGLLRAYISKDFKKYVVCRKHCTSLDPVAVTGWENEYDCLIDCGAFIGDTLEGYLVYTGFLDHYIGFEPDLRTFQQLSTFVKSQKEKLGSAFLYPCGVSDTTGLVHFEASNSVGSKISETGDMIVPTVKIDDVIPGVFRGKKLLLKMDVEGYESAVLDGAESFMKENRPDLMVCVYHKMADLWELPLKVHRMLPDYRFYLRCYTEPAVDTILYAFADCPAQRKYSK